MPAKILLVEDDPYTQDFLAQLLRARGHTVATAADGDAALSAAKAMAPDLIVCDINLPTSNGFQVLRSLRESNPTRSAPVIAITASGAQSELAEAKVHERITGLGFTAYIPKPIDGKTFVERVETFLPEGWV